MSHWQNAPHPQRRYAVVRRTLRPVRIELHPLLAGGLGVLMVALLGWAGATTAYALFRDEFLMQLVSRHSVSERTASSEISRLKADVARLNSRLLVEREGFAGKLDAMARRQSTIEQRQGIIANIAGQTPADPPSSDDLRLGDEKPVRESRIVHPRDVETRFAEIESRQNDMMAALQTKLDRDRQNLTSVYTSLGLRAAETTKAGLGGLYIPFSFGLTDTATRALDQLEEAAAETRRLREGLADVPVRSPAPGTQAVSGFGNRIDPFLGKLAFHSGIDLDAPFGAPAHATAAGTITSAGWNGGYGLMVEVKHGHGLSTRYAHLSSIAVTEGQAINIGDVVGFVGTTGRSTGPHLHYETRMGDTALDPRKFLAAGAVLAE